MSAGSIDGCDAGGAGLGRLWGRLEQARREHRIPGLAVAVVRAGSPAAFHCAGFADLAGRSPVTPETVFALGSVAKGMTVAAVGTLVESGVGGLSWDAPIGDHLGWDFRAGGTTFRQAFSHTSGMANLDLLWYGGRTSPEEVFRAAAQAEPLAAPGGRFLYNNVVFSAAATAAARAAGSGWEELVAGALFRPLGMASATSSTAAWERCVSRAIGYAKAGEGGRLRRAPLWATDVIAPAGGVYAHARDAARWVEFLLARGEWGETGEGRPLLRPAALEEMWSPHAAVGPGVHYGLGWRLQSWRGRRVVEHSGGIGGFSSSVALLPDEGVGYALLANAGPSYFTGASFHAVFDALLGGPRGAVGTRPAAVEAGPLTGRYEADFGPFLEEAVEVSWVGGEAGLSIVFPGQPRQRLEPDPEGGGDTWRPEFDGGSAVRFERGAGGEVTALTVCQAGAVELEFPREGAAPPAGVDLGVAGPLRGYYHCPQLGLGYHVWVKDNRLVVDVPGQMEYALHPPDPTGLWVTRAAGPGLAFRFGRPSLLGGKVNQLVLVQGETELVFRRAGGDTQAGLPAPRELMDRVHRAGGADALGGLGRIRMEGETRLVHQGVTGRVRVEIDGAAAFTASADLGPFGRSEVEVTAGGGWSSTPFRPRAPLAPGGAEWAAAALEHPLRHLRDWWGDFDGARVTHRDFSGEEPAFVVRLSKRGQPGRVLHVGERCGRVLREDFREIDPESGALIRQTRRFGRFRRAGGVWLATRVVTTNDATGEAVTEFGDPVTETGDGGAAAGDGGGGGAP